jgi:iron complex outermembrane receptor protein
MKLNQIDKEKKPVNLFLLIFLSLILSFNTSVFAQDDEESTETTETTDEDDVVELEPVVATGSRLLRTTYESLSPVQVITAQQSREVGQINAADILQNSTAASGQQIDLTFSGFVLDNGPGAQTASFRGLGASRTLLLVNGRRLGPSGVEGAPSAPDLGMIPGSLIQQYDLLLDGSSSIYGSDAIAGVANVILRKDFDGWEANYNTVIPEQSQGVEHQISLTWGKNFDRGFIGVGIELNDQEEIKFSDRDAYNHCNRHVEVTESGERRGVDLFTPTLGRDVGDCKRGTLVGRVIVPEAGSIYYTPGISNGAWPNFSESTLFGINLDSNGDGVADINFQDYDYNDFESDTSLQFQVKSQNLFTYGEYTFESDNNLTGYFEAGYSRRDSKQNGGQPQLFPFVSATNPYNICNPNGLNGIDCGLGYDGQFSNPATVAAIIAAFGCDPSPGGSCDQTIGPIGAQVARPVIAIRGDRSETSASLEQFRFVAGLRGDVPFINFGQMNGWTFDTYISHQQSDGVASRLGIREDRLNYSLNTSRIENGQVVCGNNDGCVPINLFAGSLYDPLISDFTTQAERDYVFDNRDFRTEVEQTIFSAFTTGYVYDLPAGPIIAGIGIELRRDKINSQPDDIARDGLFFGFFQDGGASGSKDTKEAFAEIEVPLLADVTGFKELTVNVSGRLTKDEFFSSNTTYSAKLGWRPIESLLLKATIGTSYRAPNLRENFLNSQSGFNNVFDPCGIPDAALNPITGYDPALDDRNPEILSNCLANGVDPTTLDNNGFNTYSVEIASAGAQDITEEESDSLTYGFAWDVPFFETWDITLGSTYYEIEINNTIVEPSAQFIVNDCYGDLEGDSSFCSRLTRGADGNISFVDAGFLNRDNQTVRGVDVNLNVDKSVTLFDTAVDLGLDIVLTHTKENSDLFLSDERDPATGEFTRNFDDDAGEFGLPDWSGTLNFRADFNDFRFIWQTSYIGEVNQDVDGLDEFDDISGIADTCLGPDQGDELCRNVGFAGDYFIHTASLGWTNNDWSIRAGVRNLFDREPPQVDSAEVFAFANNPVGVGYDYNGRRVFINVSRRF